MNQYTGTASHSIICPKCGRPYYYIGSPIAAPPLCQCGQGTFKGPDTFGWPFIDYKRLADEIAARLKGARFLSFDDERKCCICGRDGEAETQPGEFVAPGIRLGYGSTEGDGEYVCGDCLYGALDPLIKQAREAQPAPAPASPFRVDDDFERAPDSIGAEWRGVPARVDIVEQKPAPASPEGGEA